jgi:hypothetical protein
MDGKPQHQCYYSSNCKQLEQEQEPHKVLR